MVDPPAQAPSLDALDAGAQAVTEAAYRARVARQRADAARIEEVRLRAELQALLEASGDGSVARGGEVVYFLERAPAGARVDVDALRRHADSLADLGLAPRTETVEILPTLTAIRLARAALRRRGIQVAELVEEGPAVLKLRSRTLGAEPDEPVA